MEYQKLLNEWIISCLKYPEEEFFDKLTLKINDHYDTLGSFSSNQPKVITTKGLKNKNKEKGNLFEYMCYRLIQLNAFKFIRAQQVWLFKDIPDNVRSYLGFSHKDMGIDIVVQTTGNEYSLCERTGPPEKWYKLVVITTAQSVNRQGFKNDTDVSLCLGTFRGLDKSVWFSFIGSPGNTLNASFSVTTEKDINQPTIEEKNNEKDQVDLVTLRLQRLKFLEKS